MIKKLSIRQPDDWHVHFREDEMLSVITKHSSRINRRCIAMPNTTIPITRSTQAKNYKSIIERNSNHKNFEALIPCYITDNLDLHDFTDALKQNIFIGGKLYPFNSTTNSSLGVSDINKIFKVFEESNNSKSSAIKVLKKYVPDFSHIETGKNLDQKM